MIACMGLGAASSGCFIITDNGGDPAPPVDPAGEESIDPGAGMTPTPGLGAGLFIEYASGGDWTLFVTCDTEVTDAACAFDVIVTVDPGAGLAAPELSGESPDDTVRLVDGGFHLYTVTTGEMPMVTFSADPGAGVTVDMLLDGFAQPEYVNWVSGGVQQQDPGVNPVRFTPLFD
jgi:hypothetical protein